MSDGGRAAGRLLAAAILLLLVAVWVEPPGSWLAEPDEPRYAEIPREMLASGDLVTPRLNGVPYFEKPPLLYWANAASLRLFGKNPSAARLPTRLAGLGTTLLVFLMVRRARGRETGLAAAAFFLAAPLAFTFCRLNLTDGLLTFFLTATLLAGREAVDRGQSGRAVAGVSALAGALAAAGFLTKGLIAIVLPAGILLFWSVATRRARHLVPLLIGPALPVFVAISAPWFWLAEQRNPGLLNFFFIHEHFQRFATPVASRPGPIYYFVVVFLLGFLPGLPFFFAGWKRVRPDADALFHAIWFAVILVFFSLSKSKLSPYLFPAFPAAAALAARGFVQGRQRPGRWLSSALLSTMLVVAVLAVPAVRKAVTAEGTEWLAGAAALLLLIGSWAAWTCRRRPIAALAFLAGGWGLLYVGLAFLYPGTSTARDLHELAQSALRARTVSHAPVVSYRTYLQTFPWELESIVPLADYKGELEDWFLPQERRRDIFWTRETFWSAWNAGPLIALARTRDRGDFPAAARVIDSRGKYCLVTNVR